MPDTETVRAFSDFAYDNASYSQAAYAPQSDDDDVEDSLHQAQELIGRAMSSRRRDSHQMRHLPGDDESFDTAATDMITQARREVLCVLSVRDMSADRRATMLPLLQRAHQRGVDVKALVPSQVTSTEIAAELTRGGQPRYRTRELPDQSLLITDGKQAALRTPQRPDGPAHTLLVSVDPLVQVLRSMFGFTWTNGIPLAELLQIHGKLHGEPVRSILVSLGAGDKDEVAARKLGISVRTYRRHVAEIMREIRASSRFQAGARAVKLGVTL
jgi:hypothetical protein